MLKSKQIILHPLTDIESSSITLPASKSISNRALIIDALSGFKSKLDNLSEARDTQTLNQLVNSEAEVLDVIDAGTTMRFLTAYLSVNNFHKTITGSARMQERPIKILVDALRHLGGVISYKKSEGYPPLQLEGFKHNDIDYLEMPGDVSSQYISAVMMIAPYLRSGLTLKLTGKIGSRPYIEMTLKLMKHFGVNASFDGNQISIPKGTYKPNTLTVEPDWSAASYWFSIIALSENSSVFLKDLSETSLQGDSKIVEIMDQLGVAATWTSSGVELSKKDSSTKFEYDFTHCPDLAQTVIVVCAAKRIEARLTGLESLRIKETDRIAAIKTEISKFGADLVEKQNIWTVIPTTEELPDLLEFDTYEDHRMAMALAPLALKSTVKVNNPGVVIKSYPRFWEDLMKVGLRISEAS